MAIRYKSQVSAVPAAASEDANAHFRGKLGYEADPADVYFDVTHDVADFVIVDVRSPEHFASGHIPGAVNIPHALITEKRIAADYDPGTLFITYCWSPGCNGSTKGAIRFSALGYPVKEMIGGIEYWQKEGYPVEQSSDNE